MGGDVQTERRLPHRRAGGDDHEFGGLESGGHLVKMGEATGHPGNRSITLLERFNALHRGPEHLLDAGEAVIPALLGNLEDLRLGVVEQLRGARLLGVGLGDDLGGGLDQPPLDRLFLEDPRVELDVRGRGHRVDQLAEINLTANRFEVAAAFQFLAQGDVVDHHAALHQGSQGPVEPTVTLAVEHRVFDQLGAAQRGFGVDHHRAEYRLFDLLAPGDLPSPDLVSRGRRGAVGRYERHPRPVASNSGCAAMPPGGR
jgi:hypothetical protein